MIKIVKNEKILNLTQHIANKNQIQDGLIEPETNDKKRILELLIFNKEDINTNTFIEKSIELLKIIKKYNIKYTLIGGLIPFVIYLYKFLSENNIIPVFSFSERKVIETIVDNKTIKSLIFEHKFFYKI